MHSFALCGSFRRHPIRGMLAVFFCTILAPLAPNSNPQNLQPVRSSPNSARQLASEGRQLFETSCAGCHGLDGRSGERGPDIAKRQQVVQFSDAELLEILRAGRPAAGMPPFDSLGEAKLKAVLAYLRSLQGKGTATTFPGNPRNGKALFFGKARCSECHTVQGAGGFLGRDLSLYGAALSPEEIRTNFLRPAASISKTNKLAVFTIRDSSKLSGIIRNEDNFSIQLQSTDGTFHFLRRSDVARMEFLPKPIMPDDYVATLKPSEIDDLVSYLMEIAKSGSNGDNPDGEDDN